MKTRNQAKAFLRNDEQKVVANGYPNLRVDGVLGGPVEGLDVKMLLNPLKKQLNLPPLAVQFCDSERVLYGKVVRQEAIKLSGLKAFIHNEYHRVWILSGGVVAGKSDRLIGKDSRSYVDRSGLNDLIDHVVFGPGDKVGSLLMEELVEFLKRERSLAVMELCPRAQLQTEIDRAAIERIYHLLKTNPQLFILVERGGFLNQSHRKVLIDTPILLLVGLCKRRSGHHLDTRPVEVSAEVKCSFNVSQTSPVGELGKAHHHELVTTVELDGVPVALVAVDTLFEFIFVEERHELSEDCFSFVHGLRMAS